MWPLRTAGAGAAPGFGAAGFSCAAAPRGSAPTTDASANDRPAISRNWRRSMSGALRTAAHRLHHAEQGDDPASDHQPDRLVARGALERLRESGREGVVRFQAEEQQHEADDDQAEADDATVLHDVLLAPSRNPAMQDRGSREA